MHEDGGGGWEMRGKEREKRIFLKTKSWIRAVRGEEVCLKQLDGGRRSEEDLREEGEVENEG